MNIFSVCTNLPSKSCPSHGIFVLRRLERMAELAKLRALLPQPWFPIVCPRELNPPLNAAKFSVDSADMFYLPGIGNHFNGRFIRNCVGKWLDGLGNDVTANGILDAHFGYPEGVGCFLAGRDRGIPVFITIRGLEVDLFNASSRGPQLIQALSEATGVIAVSHSLKDESIAAGVPEEQITVIPNGVDTATYQMGDKNLARSVAGYQGSEKLVVSVGNLKPVKGHDILIKSIASVTKSCQVQLVCIGGGLNTAWGRKLMQLAAELGVSNRIRFIGSQTTNEVANWLRAADLFALASRREGCCNSVLEALATGLPVATTDAGDNRIFVKEPDCGRIAAKEDPISMANAILNCLDSQFDRSCIAETVKDLSWQSVAKRVLATFESRTS